MPKINIVNKKETSDNKASQITTGTITASGGHAIVGNNFGDNLDLSYRTTNHPPSSLPIRTNLLPSLVSDQEKASNYEAIEPKVISETSSLKRRFSQLEIKNSSDPTKRKNLIIGRQEL